MCNYIIEILRSLHQGAPHATLTALINDLKATSLALPEPIQSATLIFAEQVLFQSDYDPWHNLTPNVEQAANHLLRLL